MIVWDLATDIGIASALILAAKYIRTRVKLTQRLYIPVAMIAGHAGLLLGPNGLGYFSFSAAAEGYGGMLIAAIFAAIGLSTRFPTLSVLVNRTGKLWAYNQVATVSQWCLAIIAGLYFLGQLAPDISPAFGLIMPAGFMGGHGTASVVGSALGELGWQDGLTLALASATFGIFTAVLGGMAIINLGARFGLIGNIARFEDLGAQFRKGLIPKEDRSSVGDETVASSSINVFTLHLSMIALVTVAAYYVAGYLSSFYEFVSVPIFACAFLLGCFARYVLKASDSLQHFDDRLFYMSAGAATDYLVFFGIASIEVTVLITYASPFLALMMMGLTLCVVLVFFVAPRMLGQQWFEKSIFSWGWMTGTVAMGILLLRIVDPKGEMNILEDYAIAYVPGSMVDIILISVLPSMVMAGYGVTALIVLLTYLTLVVGISLLLNRDERFG